MQHDIVIAKGASEKIWGTLDDNNLCKFLEIAPKQARVSFHGAIPLPSTPELD